MKIIIATTDKNITNYFTISNNEEKDEISISASKIYKSTEVAEMHTLEERVSFDNMVIDICKSKEELELKIKNFLKDEIDREREIIYLNHEYSKLYTMHKIVYLNEPSLENIESMDREYDILVRGVETKIFELKTLYLEPMYEEYKNRKRNSDKKLLAFYRIIRIVPSYTYLDQLFIQLKELETLITKNSELMEILNTLFIPDLKEKLKFKYKLQNIYKEKHTFYSKF